MRVNLPYQILQTKSVATEQITDNLPHLRTDERPGIGYRIETSQKGQHNHLGTTYRTGKKDEALAAKHTVSH